MCLIFVFMLWCVRLVSPTCLSACTNCENIFLWQSDSQPHILTQHHSILNTTWKYALIIPSTLYSISRIFQKYRLRVAIFLLTIDCISEGKIISSHQQCWLGDYNWNLICIYDNFNISAGTWGLILYRTSFADEEINMLIVSAFPFLLIID